MEEAFTPGHPHLHTWVLDIRTRLLARMADLGLARRCDPVAALLLPMAPGGQEAEAKGKRIRRYRVRDPMASGIRLAVRRPGADPWLLDRRVEPLQIQLGRRLAGLGSRAELTRPGAFQGRGIKFGKMPAAPDLPALHSIITAI